MGKVSRRLDRARRSRLIGRRELSEAWSGEIKGGLLVKELGKTGSNRDQNRLEKERPRESRRNRLLEGRVEGLVVLLSVAEGGAMGEGGRRWILGIGAERRGRGS